MPYKRYDLRESYRNNNGLIYSEQFAARKVRMIDQYATPMILYPTVEELADFTIVNHIWKIGDRFYKLSYEYYGAVDYWWIISWFNQKPLETDIALGDALNIPFPIDELITYFR